MSERRPNALVLGAGNFFFKYRNAAFPAVFAVLFLMADPHEFFGTNISLQRAIKYFGVALVILGQLFRLMVIGYAYIKRGGKEGKVYADKLVIRGFYAHTRNPMYVGNALVVTGFCLVYQSVWSYFVALPIFLFSYYAITVAEEAYLRTRFGADYEHYTKTVNRFIPNFRGLKASLAEFHYDWKRALRKDYGNIAQAALALCAIEARGGGWTLTPRLLTGLALTGIFYLIARILKKSGYLASPN